MPDSPCALGRIRMDDVGVAGNAADRQIVIAKCIADENALVPADLTGRQIDILEVHVELHGIELQRTNPSGGLLDPVWKISGKNADLQHAAPLPDGLNFRC